MNMHLDKNQLKAVKANERNVLVVAAPGSGKTTVIINRIKYLVDEVGVYPSNIIVITFTKAAALNMKNRYINTFHKESSPFFGTFHGLFYKILLREGANINIIEGYITNKIIEGVLRKYSDEVNEDRVKEAVNNISLFKTSGENINDFKPSIAKDIFMECYDAYDKYKKENNLWDFDDLTIKVLELFKNNKRIREGYKRVFKYILVDEFQDCDDLQIEFLKLMTEGEENSLFAVGDEDQCIYSFRGSKPEYMVSFDKTFKSAKKYYLHINYRSNKNIIESSKKVISFNKERNKKDIQWYKDKDGIILCKGVYDERIQGDEISGKIRAFYNKSSYRYKENIVLYRTNMEAMSVIDSFIRNKIPFTLLDKEYNFFNHFICKDLLSYLSLAMNPYDREAFINIINKPFRYVSKTSIAYIREYKYEKDTFDILIEKDDTPPFQRKKLDELKRDFNYIKKSSLSSGIQYIVTDMGYIDYLKTYTERFGGNIEDLEEIVEEFKMSASSFKTIFEFFEHVDEVGKKIEESKRNKTDDRVLLSTIHGVKGMEFENVFLINCNEDTMPHSSSKEENIEEERRLFYVGITRAIDNLFLFVPKMRKGKFRDASRFIEEGGFMEIVKASHGLVKDSVVTHKAFGTGKVVEVNGDEVGILFHDGMKRKFSAKVLLDNGLISK
ncbi:ATP-dependent helicase [Clostridium paraputrificum]|nr:MULTISPECIES: ATP-dependent helicase [Clostridium]MDB2074785.1 ATP-dependent helicase [Clostridium paraputrificum]MDB2079282.1 ATP-dependent helicase [Clostridium paraputrificum]MDB2085491.1 ATP-dependent helicase [Clostridium paraputrificum]MDB2093650.1 ATP-dependent helicase [Clostridium paraputrificum]MDB2100909.1 ATP-dependent helicase [Clostridium paraputrificum]